MLYIVVDASSQGKILSTLHPSLLFPPLSWKFCMPYSSEFSDSMPQFIVYSFHYTLTSCVIL